MGEYNVLMKLYGLFKEMIKNQQAMLESNRFTVIKDRKNKKVYNLIKLKNERLLRSSQ